MGNAKFRGLPAPKPLGRFSKKIAGLITSRTPPHMQILGSIGLKGACLRMREIVTLRRLFFSLFWVPCASLQVGPLDRSSPLTAQMTRSGSHHVLFIASLIKKNIFFSILPKNVKKTALHPMGTLNSYNFGIVEDTYKLFAPNRGFWWSVNLNVSLITLSNQKLHYTLWEHWATITLASLKICTGCLHQAGVFRGRQYNDVI